MPSRTRPVFILFVIVALSLAVALSFSQTATSNLTSIPANIILTNVSIPATFGSHSTLLFTVGLENNGGLASSNITLNAHISGPSSYNDSFAGGALSPLENESLIISRENRTILPGNYRITLNANYIVNGTVQYTNSLNGSYNVTSVQTWPNETKTLIQQNANLSITYAPLYTSLFLNNQSISQIGLKDSSPFAELVNISTKRNYTSLIALSTNSVYLQHNESLYVQFVIKSRNANTSIASYDIPINFNITNSQGGKSNLTEHIILSIDNSTPYQPRVLNELDILNSSNSIIGTVELSSAINSSLQNATLTTILPAAAAANITQIMTYGMNATIAKYGSRYEIIWQPPYLPAGQVVYGYYTLKDAKSDNIALHIQNILSVPSQLKPTNLLKIINFSIPTFYTNSTEQLSVSVLYTGTQEQPVYIYLTAPPGTSVYNSSQSFNATPNEMLDKTFTIKSSKNSGTLILTLYVNTQGANLTYSLPVLVLQSESTGHSQSKSPPILPAINYKQFELYGEIGGGILLAVLLIYAIILIINHPRYNGERAKRLLNIREQIKRQSGEIG